MTRATLGDHARVAWDLVGRRVFFALVAIVAVVHLGLWMNLATDHPGCYLDAPAIEYHSWGYANDSARYKWLAEHRGECYVPMWSWVVPWSSASFAGGVGAILAVILVALGRSFVKAYLYRLRVAVAEREDRERGAFFYPMEEKR